MRWVNSASLVHSAAQRVGYIGRRGRHRRRAQVAAPPRDGATERLRWDFRDAVNARSSSSPSAAGAAARFRFHQSRASAISRRARGMMTIACGIWIGGCSW